MFFIAVDAVLGHPTKTFEALRIQNPIAVDGRLDEAVWQLAPELSDFVQVEPFNLRRASFDTKVRVLYDDMGIYVGATLYDPYPDSIIKELRKRDEFGLADAFGLKIDPYCDGLSSYGFFVTVRGVQIDLKTNDKNRDDFNWDAVWRSAVSIEQQGWTAEMMIPYSALRFPKADIQQWNVNFFRGIQRYREISSWSPIDANLKFSNLQMGRMTILSPIEPPLRISFTPYLSAGATHRGDKKTWSGAYNAGMDVKVGLSESFTLDMTLVPDFGQVESDQYFYTLSPFEIYYEERRPFFTEGTELFSKGNIFYSRRIGGRPQKYFEVANAHHPDSILNNPESIQLINASKLTGKTKRGLGVGVFNAITAPAQARVLLASGNTETIVTESLTNYNMLVLEQSLSDNGQVSFFNTHVWKPNERSSVFVTGAETRLRNRQNSVEWYGMAAISHQSLSADPALAGDRLHFNVEKIKGRFRPEVWFSVLSDRYNPNDMGFLHHNNEMQTGGEISYNEFEPRGRLLKWYARLKINQIYQYRPQDYVSTILQADGRMTLNNHLTMGANLRYLPFGKSDYFEARSKGSVFVRPPEISVGFWGSPDYRKKLIADYRFNLARISEWDAHTLGLQISPRYRINNQTVLIASGGYEQQFNNYGYVRKLATLSQEEIVFGRRNIRTITSHISMDQSFTANTSLMFRLRHYLLQVDYLDFYTLTNDGSLRSSSIDLDEDFVVNNLNIDLLFRWNFLPGSELLLIWKQAVNEHKSGKESLSGYFDHFFDIGQVPGMNNLSFKLLYYIDWNQIKQFRGNI